jgi:salicylate hydroxylase
MAGDSCHPILPYMARGANSAFEDAAVLGAVLSRVPRALQLPQATQLYESIRQFRT